LGYFGYILLNHVLPKQAVLTHGLQLQYFKLSIDADILPFLATFLPNIGQNFIQFSSHTAIFTPCRVFKNFLRISYDHS
jgi:hypothetical protein